ncbi:hypothetical protein RB623_23795 [Mesorhizobium sp. LHD-90]|uniref:hypothetical protein n=1 Tax=Mesorhizobium sp. LHD-90 TaxID=3071414 RepID=UPI0027E1A709|nr:hypothetical protein [Mesorhizobium sp. LHD-90]MDQ6437087.1 hypothetical protein [Mesorhizobium sp. LHD-90]
MTRILLIAAAFGLAASSAQACEYQRSAQAGQVDKTVVASVATPQSEPVTLPEASAQTPQQVAPAAE